MTACPELGMALHMFVQSQRRPSPFEAEDSGEGAFLIPVTPSQQGERESGSMKRGYLQKTAVEVGVGVKAGVGVGGGHGCRCRGRYNGGRGCGMRHAGGNRPKQGTSPRQARGPGSRGQTLDGYLATADASLDRGLSPTELTAVA